MVEQSVLVVDNGTFECKAGMEGETPEIVMKNRVYRVKEKNGNILYMIETSKKKKMYPNTAISVKTMFDGPVVYNYDVFMGTVKALVSEVEKAQTKNLVITECFLNPKVFKAQALQVLFDSLKFQKVGIGYDFVYAYEHNIKHNPGMELGAPPGSSSCTSSSPEEGREKPFCDVIVSMGHQGVYTVPVDPVKKRILYALSTFLPLGGASAQMLFYNSLLAKYHTTGVKVSKEEIEDMFKHMRVAEEYFEEAEAVVHTGKGNIQFFSKVPKKEKTLSASKPFPKKKKPASPEHARAEEKKKHHKRQEREEVEEADEDVDEVEEAEEVDEVEIEAEERDADAGEKEEETIPEEDPVQAEENEAKRLKREKLIKGATDHRNKQKLVNLLHRLSKHTAVLEDRRIQLFSPEEYIHMKKERLNQLEKILRKRTFVRNELKNKKSAHSLALLKKAVSSDIPSGYVEENLHLQDIAEAQESDAELLKEIDYLDAFLRENDTTYCVKEENICDKIRYGYTKERGGVNINIELIRTTEALFSPSIFGIEQPGLTESLSDIFQAYNVRNVFVTGGFSQIKGLKERLTKEVCSLRYHPNTPNVVFSLDPVYDAFRGASLNSEYFPVYTQEEYQKHGESIIPDSPNA
ncbi:actin-related protein 5 [Nematocida sp. AWRm77]|nr:actin-related protein 5 [Nematocida sp. AWRm77]